MSVEPQKFFVGVIDFFSVLLPGALLTYLVKDALGPSFLGRSYLELAGVEAWGVFLVSAYLLGHLVFLLGSWLLDDRVYDPLRRATPGEEARRLANGGTLSPYWARWAAARLFRSNVDRAVRRAVAIKQHYLGPLNAGPAVNAFQWCRARLTLEHPEAAATVHRFEADSKFFRSLTVVLALLVLGGIGTGRPGIALTSLIVLPLAFWRYVDQRVKATSQAYWYIITLEAERENGFREAPSTELAGCTHAGGVVFRRADNATEYLLVEARRTPGEWVLPKGHIEPGEEPGETAVREVREETGVWARIVGELDTIEFTMNGQLVRVGNYLMEALEEGEPEERGRGRKWLPLGLALDLATHEQTRALLEAAARSRSGGRMPPREMPPAPPRPAVPKAEEPGSLFDEQGALPTID